jgi:hypothetical protein
LSSRLRFLDDCTVGDSWATDGMVSEGSLGMARMVQMSRDVDGGRDLAGLHGRTGSEVKEKRHVVRVEARLLNPIRECQVPSRFFHSTVPSHQTLTKQMRHCVAQCGACPRLPGSPGQGRVKCNPEIGESAWPWRRLHSEMCLFANPSAAPDRQHDNPRPRQGAWRLERASKGLAIHCQAAAALPKDRDNRSSCQGV